MTTRDYLDEYVREMPLPDDGRHLATQRAALREVLKLSGASVKPAETQIERRHAQAAEADEKRHRETTERIEQRYHELTEAAQQSHQEQIQQIQNQFATDLHKLEADKADALERTIDESESARREARKRFDDALWLAESVLTANRDKIRKEQQRNREEAPAIRGRLDALQEQALWLLREYRVEPPAAAQPSGAPPASSDEPTELFRRQHESAQQFLQALHSLRTPRLFVGLRPYVTSTLLCGASAGLAAFMSVMQVPYWPNAAISTPAALLLSLGAVLAAGSALRQRAIRQVKALYLPLIAALEEARQALDLRLQQTIQQLQQREKEVIAAYETETGGAKRQFESAAADIEQRRTSSRQRIEETYARVRGELESRRDTALHDTQEEYQQHQGDLRQRYEHDQAAAREKHERHLQECRRQYDRERNLLENRWKIGLELIHRLTAESAALSAAGPAADWNHGCWQQWSPPRQFAAAVRFGRFHVDLAQLANGARRLADFGQDGPGEVLVPALLTFTQQCSLLLQSGGEALEEALRTLRAVMLRLLVALPPGRVRFTIIDPVGLGENFAGFMHLADYDEALVGGRIWTDAIHVEQRLGELTYHMENVIQKYLRNEFETIEAYNAQAGDLAEPYRFLVIAHFPANFTEDAARRLSSIISSGGRCGVYTLIVHDTRQPLPPGIEEDDLRAHSVHLVHKGGRFTWRDEVFSRFPLELDAPPPEEMLTQFMHVVGRAAKEAKRVEVSFPPLTPAEPQYWTSYSGEELRVPVGRTGAVRLQHLRLGRGVAQHLLIAGKTGAGKSTLLHVIITNLALWYSPQEVEFYLVDFKKGVEFKTYVTHELPHARAIAIESDREFGLSVLHRLDAEMGRRGDLFRQAGVQDIAAYRQATGQALPRTLLIVDEFQIFFSEDDKLAQDAAILLDRLVRQGRAFGLHALLGSQTLGGTSGLARSTIGQMAVRIALQCSEADSQLILDDNNTAARLLSRPGEAIYNDAGGLVEGNNPFQTAWLPDEQRDAFLTRVSELATRNGLRREPLIVFEGNVPADVGKNRLLAEVLEAPQWPASLSPPRVWLGEPVAIKEPTSVILRRQSGANLLVVGQRDDAAMAIMSAALVSLAAQHEPASGRFVVLNGCPADSPLAGELARTAAALPHQCRMIEWREVAETMAELAAEMHRRHEADQSNTPAIYLLIYGLQRYRTLRRSEDDFGFTRGDAEAVPKPDRLFAELLRDGPTVGIHVLTWVDTPASLERTLDRQSMREFDNRVLFQMSAADSSNLIDSPLANKLGFYRALYFSEEMGLLEKFRPYACPDPAWLETVKNHLGRR